MSGPAGASTSTRPEARPKIRPQVRDDGPPRFRQPSPLDPRRRALIGVVLGLCVVIVAILVVQARGSDDGSQVGAWNGHPLPPRASRIDTFDAVGPLGAVADFGTWAGMGTPWTQQGGYLVSTGNGTTVATVEAGTVDVLVHAQVIEASAGGGLVLSATPDGQRGLRLVAGRAGGGWQLLQRGLAGEQLVQAFDAPTDHVVVQVVRQGDRVKVSFDAKAFDVELPFDNGGGTSVGVVASLPGTAFDLFGYLPLDAG